MRLALCAFVWLLAAAAGAEAPVDEVRLTDLGAAAQQALREDFVAANPGSGWTPQAVQVEPRRGFVNSASAPARGDEPSAAEARRIALEFVARNASHLGIDATALPKLTATYAPGLRKNVAVEARKLGYPGYEDFPALTYDVHVLLEVKGGAVRRVLNYSTRLPFSLPRLKTTPSISSSDASIRAQLIGRELLFADFGGRLRSAGRITESDIESVTLVMAQEHAEDALVVTLAWRFAVRRDGLPWTLFFSAHDGELVALHQDFQT